MKLGTNKFLLVFCVKRIVKVLWNNLVLICNICKSVVIKLLRTMVISPVYYVVWMSRPG